MNATSALAIGLTCLGLLSIGGCTTASGLDASSKFSCSAPDGITCLSVSGIYANSKAGTLPAMQPKSAASSEAAGSPSAVAAAPVGQAREIVAAYGGLAALAVAATTGITAGIAMARIGGGWLVDRFAVPHVACAAHALALCGGVLLTLFPTPVTAVVGLGMIGLGYGFVSGSTAGGIGIYWPPADYGRVAGRTYIAWCLAAISLPVLAGYLFDMTRTYNTAVLIAAGANLTGMAVALTMPKQGWRDSG